MVSKLASQTYVEKCKQLNVGPLTGSHYFIDEETNKKNILRMAEERDMGVIFTSNLKWATQCQKMAAKAMSVLDTIKIYLTQL